MMVVLLAAVVAAAAAGAPMWRWRADGDLAGWLPVNFEKVDVNNGMLRGLTRHDCQLVSPPVAVDAGVYTLLEFRAASSVTGGGELFWHGAGESFAATRMAGHTLLASERPRVYRIDLSADPAWQGTVTGMRLDLLNAAGATVALDYVRLLEHDWGGVANGGFEDDFDGDGQPDGWEAEGGRLKWSGAHVALGDRALCVESAAGQETPAVVRSRVPLDGMGMFALSAVLTGLEGGPPREVRASLSYFDVFGRPLPDPPTVVSALGPADAHGRRRLGGEFVAPRLAAGADLRLAVSDPNVRAWWDEVRLDHLRELPDPLAGPLETWRAHWIWAAATAGRDQVPALLRKTFELDVLPLQVSSARAQITADDAYELSVNGTVVARTPAGLDQWRTPAVVDLKPHLQFGRNVIAVEARGNRMRHRGM